MLSSFPAGVVSNRHLSGYTTALSSLLGLFVLRVLAQALIAIGYGAFLPPWEEWFSGLVPYPQLLASQMVIILGYGKVCLDFIRQRGFFVTPRRWLGTPVADHRFRVPRGDGASICHPHVALPARALDRRSDSDRVSLGPRGVHPGARDLPLAIVSRPGPAIACGALDASRRVPGDRRRRPGLGRLPTLTDNSRRDARRTPTGACREDRTRRCR